MSDANFPVELLRDRKGIYGIGVAKDNQSKLENLILRPDKLLRSKTDCAALQMIPGSSNQKSFQHTLEEHLRNEIHFGILRRKGFPWFSHTDWCDERKKTRAKYRCEYHGTRQASRKVINRLIHAALEEAADPMGLAMARRFPLKYRYDIYHATTLSHRALQFIEVFPALGLKIYGRRVEQEHEPLVQGAKRLVEMGAPLRTIAELMEVPMAFRRVKPGAANLALRVIDAIQDPRLVDAYLPDSLPKMRNWFEFIMEAERGGSEFVDWISRRAWEIEGSRHEVCRIIHGLSDWVRASQRVALGQRNMDNNGPGAQFIVRPFTPEMAVETVMTLSGEWHEAVAAHMSGPNYEFPKPWCPGGEYDGFDIVPITNSAELYLEGRLMHHCVGTYAKEICKGESCIFSVRKDGERVATLELTTDGTSVELSQIEGACNSTPTKKVMRAVKRWFRSQHIFE